MDAEEIASPQIVVATPIRKVSRPEVKTAPVSSNEVPALLAPIQVSTHAASANANTHFSERMFPAQRVSTAPFPWRKLRLPAALAIGVLVLVIGGIAVLRHVPKTGMLGNSLKAPFAPYITSLDSHQQVFDGYQGVYERLNNRHKFTSLADVVAESKSINQEIRGLITRATNLGLVDLNEWVPIATIMNKQAMEMEKRTREEREEFDRKMNALTEKTKALMESNNQSEVEPKRPFKLDLSHLPNPFSNATEQEVKELIAADRDLAQSFASLLKIIAGCWGPFETPETAIEQVEYDVMLIRRKVYVAIITVATENDYKSLDYVLDDAAIEIKKTISENQLMMDEKWRQRSEGKYGSNFSSDRMSDELFQLRIKYVSVDIKDSFKRFLEALARFHTGGDRIPYFF